LKKLLDYTGKLNLRLKLVDEESISTLPGKPLSPAALKSLYSKAANQVLFSWKLRIKYFAKIFMQTSYTRQLLNSPRLIDLI